MGCRRSWPPTAGRHAVVRRLADEGADRRLLAVHPAGPPAVGLLPQSRRDRAHLRGRRRRAVRDPDGRWTVGGLAGVLPGIGIRGALLRERGEGDDRPEAGVRAVRAVTAGAALVLGPP